MTLNNKPERTDNTTAMWQMAIKDQTPAALCGHKMIPLTWCWWRFCWDLFSSEHWPRLLPPDSGTRSVPRLHLSLSAGAKHSRPAAKPWTGAESQSYERTDVSTPLLHLLPTFTTTTTVLVPCCVLSCRYSALFSFFLLRFVLKELIQTEKDYVKDLGIVVEVRHPHIYACMCLQPPC